MAFASEAKLHAEISRLYNKRYKYTDRRRIAIEKFYKNSAEEVKNLHDEIQSRRYKPYIEGVLIKIGDKKRGISPLRPRDFIVQKLVLEELRALGFRLRTSSPRDLVQKLAITRPKFLSAVKGDLKNFFPSVDRGRVKSLLLPKLGDGTVLGTLVESILDCDVVPPRDCSPEEREKFWPSSVGVPQGTVLAPLFAELFLQGWPGELPSTVRFYRYVDDFIVIGETPEACMSAFEIATGSLPRNLQISKEKSQAVGCDENISFLGLEVTPCGRVEVPSLAVDRAFTKIAAILGNTKLPFVGRALQLRLFLSGWISYYSQFNGRDPKKTKSLIFQFARDELGRRLSSELNGFGGTLDGKGSKPGGSSNRTGVLCPKQLLNYMLKGVSKAPERFLKEVNLETTGEFGASTALEDVILVEMMHATRGKSKLEI